MPAATLAGAPTTARACNHDVDDLARLIGLKAALDGTVAWPKVDTSSLEQQPMLALVFLLNHRDSEGYLPLASVRAAHAGTHAGDRPLGRRLRQARLG